MTHDQIVFVAGCFSGGILVWTLALVALRRPDLVTVTMERHMDGNSVRVQVTATSLEEARRMAAEILADWDATIEEASR